MYLGRGWASVDGKREAVTSASAIAVRGDDGVPFHNLYLILIVAVLATVPMDIIPVLAIAIGGMTIGGMTIGAIAICDAVVDEGTVLILTKLAHKLRFQS